MKISIRLIAAMACMAACMACMGQRTTRQHLKPRVAVAAADTVAALDTIAIGAPDSVAVSGYEKTLRARRESMLVTNKGTRAIEGVNVTIDYYDMAKRQLHQRTITIDTHVPAGETRMTSIPSWDKQCVWYYSLSEPPRTRFQATPYTVSIKVNYFLTLPSSH